MRNSLKHNSTLIIYRRVFTIFFALWVTFASFGAAGAVGQGNAEKKPIEIVALGDSLTAGYGLGPGEGYTDQLQNWLNENMEVPVKVINAGVSGDTSTGGRSRMDWAIAPIKGGKPDLVILELGANDALRGVSPEITRENIFAMVKVLKERGIPTLIAGMLATPSWGKDYGQKFDTIFPDVAQEYSVPLYPFFLDGVAADPALNQDDGLHPNVKGVAIIIEKMGPVIKEQLEAGL
ncbi:arylesterase [Kordiimonas sp. SCSIO 12610]|uniref:arylesterase n=1 Tax=Kordiimonas sp. SCSIO 12610 TaxID=2829597 RepID=UPI00210A5694|nr:arylesterase [Kordiimonas sp. SCSIO 12610]UTW55193.1 arylesterase [Kordiimonas sp. SCSIO 12610]